MSDLHARQLLRLTMLLQLEKRARGAGSDELAFLMVNETLSVLRYRQALVWRGAPANRVLAVSGVAIPDQRSPFLVWASRLCAQIGTDPSEDIREITADDVPSDLRAEWSEWLPPYLVWVPLGGKLGALVLGREEALSEGDRNLLVVLGDAYGHAWQAQLAKRRLRDKGWFTGTRKKAMAAVVVILLIALGLIPVRQSVLAPAEIAPRDAAMIRAPLEGVIDSVLVRPNEPVQKGQILFALDRRKLQNQLDVAQRAQEAAETELRQAKQFAVVDYKVRASLPELQGKFEQAAAEVTYLKEQMSRIEVRAPQSGLAVFDDPNDWLGRPVAIGERVMLLADPEKVEVEARLSVADAIDLDIGGPVRLFLNVDPARPREAVLTFVSYQAQKSPDGILGYRVKARLAEGESLPRIGLKGTAKLYGTKVPLAYAIFRRPISAARQWLGL
jgi:hypothetical protein